MAYTEKLEKIVNKLRHCGLEDEAIKELLVGLFVAYDDNACSNEIAKIRK